MMITALSSAKGQSLSGTLRCSRAVRALSVIVLPARSLRPFSHGVPGAVGAKMIPPSLHHYSSFDR